MTQYRWWHVVRFAGLLALSLAAAPSRAHDPATEDMVRAARNFLQALTPEQRQQATFPFTDAERENFHFIPRDRLGIPWKDLSTAQQQLAISLMSSGLSHRGFSKAATIMSLEEILRDLEQGSGPTRDSQAYYWTIFGTPASHEKPWGWRVEGHHLSINFTLSPDGQVSSTPSFFGTNPAEVRQGPRAGLRVLHAEEDLGRSLVRSLSPELRRQAVIAETAPADIFTAARRRIDPLKPDGVGFAILPADARILLRQLVEEYVRRARAEVADADLAEIETAGWNHVHFAWAGPIEPGQGHYYRVQGPTFVLEYDNVQNQANHIHAVWREFRGDFGEDILARHRQESPHEDRPPQP
jgi:hypothetical protein